MLIPPVGDQLPRRGNFFTNSVARLSMLLTGWRFEGALPNLPKFVLIVAPHTSNWDFPIGIMAMFGLGIRGTFLGKDTLFRRPFGFFFRWLGGFPVVRTASNNVVDQTIGFFRTRNRIILALSPEGTRRKLPQWRTGFYWVAVGAGVPIVPVAFDYPRRRVILNPPQVMSGDIDKDLAHLRGFFNAAQALRPEKY